jgi:hypothetical protein
MNREKMVISIKAWLKKMKWQYDFDADKSIFTMGVSLDGAINKVRVVMLVKDSFYLVYVMSCIGCSDNMTETIRFLTMANYGLINGNFEIDVRDGEIRYKTYVNCSDMESLPEQIISDSVMCACHTFRKYSSGIAALCLNPKSSTPEDEIKKCEKR